MEYDDEAVLTQYVWDHFQRFMTEHERRVGLAIIGRWKANNQESPQARRMMLERWGHLGNTEIDAALADGPEAFRRKVCRRVLAEYESDIFVNRCPACNSVVRTPEAQQCFWCGRDWHGQTYEEAFLAELDRRAEEIESGKDVGVPLEIVMAEMRAKYGKGAMPTRPPGEDDPQRGT